MTGNRNRTHFIVIAAGAVALFSAGVGAFGEPGHRVVGASPRSTSRIRAR
jgi:hypothetical protein